jgi:hypothetical protein
MLKYVLVRPNSDIEKVLENLGVKIYTSVIEFDELIKPCIDVSCVISSLAGLREVVIDAQKNY